MAAQLGSQFCNALFVRAGIRKKCRGFDFAHGGNYRRLRHGAG
jgi:hypothetical protein